MKRIVLLVAIIMACSYMTGVAQESDEINPTVGAKFWDLPAKTQTAVPPGGGQGFGMEGLGGLINIEYNWTDTEVVFLRRYDELMVNWSSTLTWNAGYIEGHPVYTDLLRIDPKSGYLARIMHKK